MGLKDIIAAFFPVSTRPGTGSLPPSNQAAAAGPPAGFYPTGGGGNQTGHDIGQGNLPMATGNVETTRPRIAEGKEIRQDVPEYGRDERGFPVKPGYAAPGDRPVKGDGTPERWTWEQIDTLKRHPEQRSSAFDAGAGQGIEAGGEGAEAGAPPFYPGAGQPDAAARPETEPAEDELAAKYRERAELLENGPKREGKFGKRVLGGLMRGLAAGAQGQGIGGAIGGMITGSAIEGFSPEANRMARTPQNLNRVTREIEGLERQASGRQERRYREKQIENIDRDNEYQTERLGEMRADRKRKEDDRTSREATARMNAVAGMVKDLKAYDPTDPKFAEITKALGEVGLPVTPKDTGKNIRLVQDQRTGQWTTVVTDPLSGRQEVRDVIKDGKAFRSTPAVVIQGEYGLTRQANQQRFTAEQNELARRFRAELDARDKDFRLKLKDYEKANGRERTMNNAKTRFVSDYTRSYGTPPDEATVNSYLEAIAELLKDGDE